MKYFLLCIQLFICVRGYSSLFNKLDAKQTFLTNIKASNNSNNETCSDQQNKALLECFIPYFANYSLTMEDNMFPNFTVFYGEWSNAAKFALTQRLFNTLQSCYNQLNTNCMRYSNLAKNFGNYSFNYINWLSFFEQGRDSQQGFNNTICILNNYDIAFNCIVGTNDCLGLEKSRECFVNFYNNDCSPNYSKQMCHGWAIDIWRLGLFQSYAYLNGTAIDFNILDKACDSNTNQCPAVSSCLNFNPCLLLILSLNVVIYLKLSVLK